VRDKVLKKIRHLPYCDRRLFQLRYLKIKVGRHQFGR
jgi:hypothetical protein